MNYLKACSRCAKLSNTNTGFASLARGLARISDGKRFRSQGKSTGMRLGSGRKMSGSPFDDTTFKNQVISYMKRNSPNDEETDDSPTTSKTNGVSTDNNGGNVANGELTYPWKQFDEADTPRKDRELKGSVTSIFKSLITGNSRWQDRHAVSFQENWFNVLNQQSPQVTCLTCGDSRVTFSSFGIHTPNELFGVRNIGNQVMNSEGSFKFGILELKTPLAIVMGHTGCGAVQACVGDYRAAHSAVQKEIVGLIPSITYARRMMDRHLDRKVSEEEEINIFAEVNVDYQVRMLLQDYKIEKAVIDKRLTVVGMMFDIHNAYGSNFARLKVTNVNGERNIENIKNMQLFHDIEKERADVVVQRLFEYK